jgi:hypothetical protein
VATQALLEPIRELAHMEARRENQGGESAESNERSWLDRQTMRKGKERRPVDPHAVP